MRDARASGGARQVRAARNVGGNVLRCVHYARELALDDGARPSPLRPIPRASYGCFPSPPLLAASLARLLPPAVSTACLSASRADVFWLYNRNAELVRGLHGLVLVDAYKLLISRKADVFRPGGPRDSDSQDHGFS